MKKFKRNGIILFIVTVFLLWYLLKDNWTESIKLLMTSNYWWILLCVIIYGIFFLLETFVLKNIVNQYKKDYSLKAALKLTIMTRFFNGITPFGTGGQPLQVYELTKENVKVTKGTIIIVQNFIIFQTSLIILALIAVITNSIFHYVHCESLLNTLLIIGFVVNTIILLTVYLMSVSSKLNKKIILFFIKLLTKMKIVKHPKETSKKWEQACNEYYEGYKELQKNKKLLLKLLLMEILALTIWFIMPLFIFKAIGWTGNLNIVIATLIAIYVFFVGSYVPIPGGSGGIEYAFMGFFTYYITDNSYLSSGLLLWRFINYYLPILIGGLVFNFSKRGK